MSARGPHIRRLRDQIYKFAEIMLSNRHLSCFSWAETPQGSFVIKAGATTNISFMNVFGQIMQFHLSVDNTAFTLRRQKVRALN